MKNNIFEEGVPKKNVICRNIPRQDLEREESKIEIFFPSQQWRNKEKEKCYIGSRQRELLNKLSTGKGVYLMTDNFERRGNIFMSLRTLNVHIKPKIRWLNFSNVIQQNRKIKIPNFVLLYFEGCEKDAVKVLFKKFPEIYGVPHFVQNFVSPILKVKKASRLRLKAKDINEFLDSPLVKYGTPQDRLKR